MKWLSGLVVLALCATSMAGAPQFSLAWSEYPSWSTFGVAHDIGLIDGDANEQGEIEKKYNVDIVLQVTDYDSCILLYASSQVDAACLTNIDALNPATSRKSVAILPTSTSAGADACIVPNDITDISQLKGKPMHMLVKSVSEYCAVRNIEIKGQNPADFKFANMDPGAAAIQFQQQSSGISAIVVWNPFVIETLAKRKDSHVLFDSSAIPEEIIDMVVVAQQSLDREGGDRFALAVIETFYRINQRLDSDQRDDTLIALGEKFANLTLAHMRQVVRQTKFYENPQRATEIYSPEKLQPIMKRVHDFCRSRGILERDAKITYGPKTQEDFDLRFDLTYINQVAGK